MSTYTTYSLAGIKNKEILLAAIAEMGLTPTVYDKPQTVMGGYSSRNQAKGISIVIPKSEFMKVGTYSYLDIAFGENPDGTWRVVADGHIPTMVKGEDGTPVKFEDQIQKTYAKVNGDRAITKILTTTIPRLKAQGKIPANATARKIVAAGMTKVLVTY